MTPVKSSNVESCGYDTGAKALFVKFHGGNTFKYANVPQDIYENLTGAESVGKYFAAHIKGKYESVKV